MATGKRLTRYQAWKLENWFIQTCTVAFLCMLFWAGLRLGMWAFGYADVNVDRTVTAFLFAWMCLDATYWRRRACEAEKPRITPVVHGSVIGDAAVLARRREQMRRRGISWN